MIGSRNREKAVTDRHVDGGDYLQGGIDENRVYRPNDAPQRILYRHNAIVVNALLDAVEDIGELAAGNGRRMRNENSQGDFEVCPVFALECDGLRACFLDAPAFRHHLLIDFDRKLRIEQTLARVADLVENSLFSCRIERR
jgi:hypothetical protein